MIHCPTCFCITPDGYRIICKECDCIFHPPKGVNIYVVTKRGKIKPYYISTEGFTRWQKLETER